MTPTDLGLWEWLLFAILSGMWIGICVILLVMSYPNRKRRKFWR
uniref:Uncharacterized protein n=1 Tax=viral metagenome TaxID=1070528 RepID=A0A6M3JPN2_9ZZZZ